MKKLNKFALQNGVAILSIDTGKDGAAVVLIEEGDVITHTFPLKRQDVQRLAREITSPGLIVGWPDFEVIRPRVRKDVQPRGRKSSRVN